MTTTAAGNVAGHAGEKEKEKVEKRRALGRGLEALLPGPRAVELRSTGQPGAAVPTQTHQAPESGSGAGEKQVPHRAFGPVRNDNSKEGDEVIPSIQPVAEDGEAAELRSARPGSLDSARDRLRPGPAPADAELRSAGPFDSAQGKQPGAAVPTRPLAVPSQPLVPKQSSSPVPTQSPSPVPTQSLSVPTQGLPVPAHSLSAIPATALAAQDFVLRLGIGEIDKNPYQTRYISDDEALEELANSIRANGVVQPIVVRPAAEAGRYVLILGERRLHASKKAGLGTIPAMVKRVSDQQAAEMTVIENLQREDLSALEQAEAFKVLSQEFKMTQTEIGVRVGLSRESVSNYMRLLKLPKSVMERLARKEFGFSEARVLLKLDDPEVIEKTADYVVKRHMSLEQIETLVMRMTGLLDPVPGMPGQVAKKSGGARWVDPNVRSAQTDLERLLGVRVRIRDRKGKGRIVIEYSTVDDYERVVEMLRGKKV